MHLPCLSHWKKLNIRSKYISTESCPSSTAHSTICTQLFRGKMHSNWFQRVQTLQGRWQHADKEGYWYPSGLEKTTCKWDIRTAGHDNQFHWCTVVTFPYKSYSLTHTEIPHFLSNCQIFPPQIFTTFLTPSSDTGFKNTVSIMNFILCTWCISSDSPLISPISLLFQKIGG